METRRKQKCPLTEIGAYVDGELSRQQEAALEKHIAECSVCFQELNEQKKMLCILNSAFKQVDLPDLTKPIVVCAESSVKGLRDNNSFYKLAFLLLLVLICLHYVSDSIFNFVLVFVSFFRVTYESLDGFLLGLSVILRAFSFRFSVEILLLPVFCLVSILTLAFLKKPLSLNR